VTGVEALVRWENPELWMISPLQFIRVEETGLILPIGEWVQCLMRAAAQTSFGAADILCSPS
jgi:EAL domain-containing protein (putative c-di-GMP-specific phosphodiesterase class I)